MGFYNSGWTNEAPGRFIYRPGEIDVGEEKPGLIENNVVINAQWLTVAEGG